MTEKEKMLAGDIYSAVDSQLLEELVAVKEITHDYNLLRPSEVQKGKEILKGLELHCCWQSLQSNKDTMKETP